MKVAIIHNKDLRGVINSFGMQNREFYDDRTVRKVAQCLERAGHNVAILDGNKQIIERLENFMPRVMEGETMGMVFNMAYGIQGESRYTHVPALLEMLGVPYVGSSPSGHALALDKVLTKIIWKNHGLPTPDFRVFSTPDDDLNGLYFPLIVKPKMESVSFGLKVVYDNDELRAAIAFIIREFGQQALVEQFIPGREFAIGLLGNDPVECFPILEIDLEGDSNAIQTADHKKSQPRGKICPAQLDEGTASRMQELSVSAFKTLGLRDFSRIDIRMDEKGNIYLLEINSMASLGETGSYITAAKVAGYNFHDLVNRMLDTATERNLLQDSSRGLPAEAFARGYFIPARLRSFLKARQETSESFLGKMVNFNTYTRNTKGVNECSALLSNAIEKLGFSKEVHPQVEVGDIIYMTNSTDPGTDYLILVPIDSSIKLESREPFTIRDQYLEGTGIWETKGGALVMLEALRALRSVRLLGKTRIGILIITDSRLDSRFSKGIIIEKAKYTGAVISMHGSDKHGGLVLTRSGSAVYDYEVKLLHGRDAEDVSYTAEYFHRSLAAITGISTGDPEDVIAPYRVNFRSNIYKREAHGSASISVRFSSVEKLLRIEGSMQKLFRKQRRDPKLNIEFSGGMRRPPMRSNNASEKFFEHIKAITRSIDVRINKAHRWSSGDICHIPYDIPRIDAMGPMGEFLPPDNERILRHSISERSLLLSLILKDKYNKKAAQVGEATMPKQKSPV